MTTKRELQEENDRLRERLEEAYDVIGEALRLEDDDAEEDEEDEELESDTDHDEE